MALAGIPREGNDWEFVSNVSAIQVRGECEQGGECELGFWLC